MLIPLTTNVASDRYPWVMIGLIAINTAVFFATGMGSDESTIAWSLEYGNGLHPLQWVSSIFMHAHIAHLVGNMLFLWVFGMIVEARLGWRRFLLAYLGIGIGGSALEQMMTFWFDQGRAIGASGVIFSLLGMALVWAPETEIECHWIVGRWGFARWTEVQISVLWMAVMYIGLNLFAAWRYGFRPNSAAAHTLGALLGIAFGVAMLKLGRVECDGWDLFTIVTGSYLRSSAARRRRSAESDLPPDVSRGDAASSAKAAGFVEQFQVRDDKPGTGAGQTALTDYEQSVKSSTSGQLSESELLRHADRMCGSGFENEAVPLLEEYLRRFERRADLVRLKLAELVIKTQQRPRYGLRLLEALPDGPLKPRYENLRQALTRHATAMIEDGVLELSGSQLAE
jgi:membrane associated rhomboid family serine protease